MARQSRAKKPLQSRLPGQADTHQTCTVSSWLLQNLHVLQFLERKVAKSLSTSRTEPCCDTTNGQEESKTTASCGTGVSCLLHIIPSPTPVFYFQCKDFYPDLAPPGWPETSSVLLATSRARSRLTARPESVTSFSPLLFQLSSSSSQALPWNTAS